MLTPLETITLEWSFSAVALASVVARLLVRLTFKQHQYYGRPIWMTDLLLVAGLGCAIGSSACDTLVYKLGALQDFDNPSEYLGKIRFAEKFLFDTGLYLPKLSLVLSYEMMVPKTSRRLRLFLGCIIAYLVLACMTATSATIFWCGTHPSINWLHPQKCSSFTSGRLQKVTWTLNILGELLLFIFPFSILKSLHFTGLRDRLGLGLIFSLGLITIIVTTGRFINMSISVNDISLAVWTTAETSVSVMVVATMALAPLLRKVGPTITDHLKKLFILPKWTLGIIGEEQLLPTGRKSDQLVGKYSDGDDTDGLPMPKPTAMWSMWPVDLDVNSMSVTTMTEANADATQKRTPSSRKPGIIGSSASSRSVWQKCRLAAHGRKEPGQPEMVSRGTQTLGRVVVELDPEGLPYGSSLVDTSPP
ncbi:hypothetical protein N0V93_009547 [Gnomoniopsis smithogilvyi]|uniref:Rhodopsin domain-containing protein n=1 Tax=Gnomoniopsis smithogilvyi TaxID=1191159 RepID=A0A9W8YKZ5_9PEZI|nr:hypothetical protein N0V93_009547 [Gnomoniopsis smithogilvyi]